MTVFHSIIENYLGFICAKNKLHAHILSHFTHHVKVPLSFLHNMFN